MARRVETRALQQRAADLRRRAGRLLEKVAGWSPGASGIALRRSEILALKRLADEARALTTVIRTLNPHDAAWRFYDKDMATVLDHLEAPFHTRVTTYAIYDLRRALEMVEGAASRIRNPRVNDVQALAGRMMYGEDRAARIGARSVLGDLLEEIGFLGEANAIRRGHWRFDRQVLPALGVTLPRTRPWSGYDSKGAAS